MILFRDVIYRLGKGQGCPLISAKIISHMGAIPQAMGGRKGGSSTINNVNAPWDVQYPYLREAFMEANKNYWGKDANGQPTGVTGGAPTPGTERHKFFPGQTFASFSPQTEQALNMTEQRANAGSPVQKASNEELLRTLRGDYLHGGSGFDAAYESARSKILPDIQSRFAQGGRYGSGLAREAESSALGRAFADQYGKERENQLRAMFFAPQAAQSDYADLSKLADVGAAREGQEQSKIDEAMQRHEFEQMEPTERLARYMAMVQGNYGGQQSATQQYGRGNRGAGILGGAMGGAGVGGQFGGPWGAGIGGLLGALTGLF